MPFIGGFINILSDQIKNHPKISVIATASVLMTFGLREFQKILIYQPEVDGHKSPSYNQKQYRNPSEFGFASWQKVELESEDHIKLKGWYLKQPNINPKRLVLYYHGNSGNIGHRLPFVNKLLRSTQSNVLLVSYRGFSDSEGEPSESGLKKDSITILRKAVSLSQQNKIPLYVFGKSLGGAAAVYACSQEQFCQQNNKIRGLILQNTFLSILEIAKDFLKNPILKTSLHPVLSCLICNKWQSYKLIPKIKVPTMFIKSCKDELIPKHQMDKLSELSSSTYKFNYQIKEGTHNEAWRVNQLDYFGKIVKFMQNVENTSTSS